MPKYLIAVLALAMLIFTAGNQPPAPAANYAPWDCADWQAFAHSDRATAILESLAENRGKTLYCGVDQSDTFAKAETWEAGRGHNERDGTVYQGENGRFRGFIAAQEGWLTEGESGITGQSIATIFEFPKEPPRRARRIKRLQLAADPGRLAPGPRGNSLYVDGTLGTLSPTDPVLTGNHKAQHYAQWRYHANGNGPGYNHDWVALGKTGATAYCRSIGYDHALNVETIPPVGVIEYDAGTWRATGWGYIVTPDSDSVNYTITAFLGRQYTATCVKRGPRRD